MGRGHFKTCGEEGKVQFVRSALRAVPANWTFPLLPPWTSKIPQRRTQKWKNRDLLTKKPLPGSSGSSRIFVRILHFSLLKGLWWPRGVWIESDDSAPTFVWPIAIGGASGRSTWAGARSWPIWSAACWTTSNGAGAGSASGERSSESRPGSGRRFDAGRSASGRTWLPGAFN